MTEHTPTTDEVRWCYRSEGRDPKGGRLDKEFDRWFAPYAEAFDTVQRMKALTVQDIANNLGMTDGAWVHTPKGGKHWKMAEGIHAMIYWTLEGESNE